MKTITDAINERLARTRNLKQMDAEDMIESVYRKHPKLSKIDADIIEVRSARMICSIEHDNEPLPALKKREEDLRKEREEYLEKHHIRPDFDREQVVCTKCEDTGFVTNSDGRRMVCTACMKDAIKETYDNSGMKDFGTYTLKSFDLNYFKDNGERKKKFTAIRDLIEGRSAKSLMLLNGGVQSGKTYLAIVACKYAALQGQSSYYLKADRLGSLKRDELDELKGYDLIVIDDYAPEVTQDKYNSSALHTLLEARLASGRATIIVSSAPLEVLVSDSEERIAGKLKSAGTL